jgi:cytochrome c556
MSRRNGSSARAAMCLALLALIACATDDTRPENPQAVVNERIAIMKTFAAALAAADNYARGKGTVEAARAKVAPALHGAERLKDLVPRGTALGDRGVTTSRALSTIFANRSDFDDKREALADALAAMDVALAKKSKSDLAKRIPAAKGACQACHARYRAAED